MLGVIMEMPIFENRQSIGLGVEESMILAIEPGYYADGHFGTRIGNFNLVVRCTAKNAKEKNWLNCYHKQCANIVGSELLKAKKTDVYKWLMGQIL